MKIMIGKNLTSEDKHTVKLVKEPQQGGPRAKVMESSISTIGS